MKEYLWQDITLGLRHSFEASFTEKMMQDYAALSGDYNPLHVDAAYAREQSFPGPVVFGLMTASLYSHLVGMYLPGKYALLQGIDIHFNNPCFAGEHLNVEGEVSFLSEAYQQFEIKAKIRKRNRELVSKSAIRVGFHI